jgi:hypothetical protein
MALYNVNTNLPGSKIIYTSESAVAAGTSARIPIIVCPVDPLYMQDTIDGYVQADASCTTTQILFTTPDDVNAGEYAGLYVYSSNLDEARLIDTNTAATAGNQITLYLARPFTSAPSQYDSLNIRRWEKLYVPVLMSTLEEFAEKFIGKDTSGNYTWTNSEAAFDSILVFKASGGGFFYALPVEVNDTMGSAEAASNMSATTNSDFTAYFDSISPIQSAIVLSKQPSLPITIESSDWATADAAWQTFVKNRATLDTTDPRLPACTYITDTPSASSAAAVTYRDTTWNSSSEFSVLTHGLHNIADEINGGRTRQVNSACRFAGAANFVSNTLPESFGHAVSGKYTAQGGIKSLSETLTAANRVLLQSNGINALVFKPGVGYVFESQWTQKATTATSAENPLEHFSIKTSRDTIWNAIKPILDDAIDEQNTQLRRQKIVSRISTLLDTYISQKIVLSYQVADVSTSTDISGGTMRFNVSVLFPVATKYVELTFNARI